MIWAQTELSSARGERSCVQGSFPRSGVTPSEVKSSSSARMSASNPSRLAAAQVSYLPVLSLWTRASSPPSPFACKRARRHSMYPR